MNSWTLLSLATSSLLSETNAVGMIADCCKMCKARWPTVMQNCTEDVQGGEYDSHFKCKLLCLLFFIVVYLQRIRAQVILYLIPGREGYPGILNEPILMDDGRWNECSQGF